METSNNPQLDLLRSMVAGIPTKQTQELSIKTRIYADDKNLVNLNSDLITEMVDDLPPLEYSSDSYEQITNQPKLVSEDDIMSLMMGKRPQAKVVQQPVKEAYVAPDEPRESMPDRDNFGEYNVYDELQRRLEKKQAILQDNPPILTEERKKTNVNLTLDEQTVSVIEDTVYKVLAQVINEAVKRKMGK